MADSATNGADRHRRRWSFADCVLDEASWTLTVAGRRVPVENKPLELLRELLLNAGDVVSKDDLLDAIWPDVVVVEASLPTAVSKLRAALNDDRRQAQIIETVPRIGYRLGMPVTVEELAGAAIGAVAVAPRGPPAPAGDGPVPSPVGPVRRAGRWLLVTGVAALGLGAVAIPLTQSREAPPTKEAPAFTQRDAANAIRRLDVAAIERLLAAGWDPNLPVEGEGNAALHNAVEICEWNPGVDRDRLLLVVRTLYEGGARIDLRNVWGDTPYSIAKSPRYCGPDHVVTRSLHVLCYNHHQQLDDRCLASYELARRDRP